MLSMPTMEEVSLQQSVLAALSEFGTQLPATGGRRRHLSEHCRVLIEGHALHELCKLNSYRIPFSRLPRGKGVSFHLRKTLSLSFLSFYISFISIVNYPPKHIHVLYGNWLF